MQQLTFGSLFAGIGGFDLGFERAGMKCLWQVEKDEFCRKVLAKHWPDVPKYEDVRNVGKHNLEKVDVICGGFPCQDISAAGKRRGLSGERSGLWFEFSRILRELRPDYAVVENVAALLVRGIPTVLGELAEIGYNAEWQTISPSYFNAPQSRYRVFVIAYNANKGLLRWNGGKEQAHPAFWEEIRNADFQWDQCINRILRGSNGVPYRMDRRRAIGNTVNPQTANFLGVLLQRASNKHLYSDQNPPRENSAANINSSGAASFGA